MTSKCVQASQLSETLSTCRFAQRMMQVTVDAQKNKGGMSSVHGNLFKLDPVMQQYLEVSPNVQAQCLLYRMDSFCWHTPS